MLMECHAKATPFLRRPIMAGSLLAIALVFVVPALSAQGFNGVLTWHNDVGRTGQNVNETTLNPTNVNVVTFGKVFSLPVDGNVFAQPLYVPAVNIPSQGVHNVLYIATENDSVYAFDADGQSQTPLWHVTFINPAAGITPEPCADANVGCVITPTLGITGTPVIDPSTNTIYMTAVTKENGVEVQRFHALDITTGSEKFGGPVVIQPTVPGTGPGSTKGVVHFGSAHELQRTGLLLLNGVVYMGWNGTHGWLLGFDAHTLAQVAVLNTSPNASNASIWQSGAGPAADSLGDIYVATAEGTFDADTGGVDYANSLLKLDNALHVLDYFTPMDQACRTAHDFDLASGGPIVLPTQPGVHPDELLVEGKGGSPCDQFGPTFASPFYVIDRDHLGGYNPTGDENIQTVAGPTTFLYGAPAYWQGPTNSYVYLSGFPRGNVGDFLRQYTITNGQLSTTPITTTKVKFPVGSTPSVSSNGTANGIVWTIKRQDSLDTNPGPNPAVLLAFDATNVSKELYGSTQAGSRDQAGPATKFLTPTVANGRVYVGTQTEVDVYGLLPVTLSPTSLAFATRGVGVTSPVKTITLTNTQNKTVHIMGIAASGDFVATNNCGSTLGPSASCTVSVTFTPTSSGARTGALTITDDALGSPQTASLSGTGTFMVLSATTLLFGAVPTGTTSAPLKITVTNRGNATVHIAGRFMGGTDPGDFQETDTCGVSLAPGASCKLTFTFQPGATGSRSAMFSLADDDLGSPQTIALSGSGS